MVSIDTFRQLALSLPEVTEAPHFEKTSFRVGKKILTTLDTINNQACVRLSEIDQNVFSSHDKSVFFPVPNKWGKLGWTFINLKKVKKSMLVDALTTSYCGVAPKKLSALVKPPEEKK
ncbi:MAG: MmcQ/YjbR family DNA-binding protein [Chryseolinea sp.]